MAYRKISGIWVDDANRPVNSYLSAELEKSITSMKDNKTKTIVVEQVSSINSTVQELNSRVEALENVVVNNQHKSTVKIKVKNSNIIIKRKRDN